MVSFVLILLLTQKISMKKSYIFDKKFTQRNGNCFIFLRKIQKNPTQKFDVLY